MYVSVAGSKANLGLNRNGHSSHYQELCGILHGSPWGLFSLYFGESTRNRIGSGNSMCQERYHKTKEYSVLERDLTNLANLSHFTDGESKTLR